MPTWSHPWLLSLAIAVPPLMWWWQKRQRDALRYSATGWLADLPSGRGRLVERVEWGARALALLLLIAALAGPRWPDQRTRITTEGIAIVMVVDCSGSMAERDFDWQGEPISRLEAVKRAFRLFVEGGDGPDGKQFEGRPTDQIALVTFATRPDCPCPLTLSHSVLLKLLEKVEPAKIPGEMETNISDALTLGLHRLQSAGSRRKVMVLLSDGEHNVPNTQSEWTPRQAAQVALNLDVAVYTIDAGSDLEAPGEEGAAGSSVVTRLEGQRTLEEIAHITHGRSFRAHDTGQLLSVCRDIDNFERQEIQSFQYRRYYEGYPWFGLAAFVLVAGIRGLEMSVWQRVP
ncbi:MAG: vWA domain-containing protein [Gemmataceae bacterium]